MSVLTVVSRRAGPAVMDKSHRFGATALSKGPSGSAALCVVPCHPIQVFARSTDRLMARLPHPRQVLPAHISRLTAVALQT